MAFSVRSVTGAPSDSLPSASSATDRMAFDFIFSSLGSLGTRKIYRRGARPPTLEGAFTTRRAISAFLMIHEYLHFFARLWFLSHCETKVSLCAFFRGGARAGIQGISPP